MKTLLNTRPDKWRRWVGLALCTALGLAASGAMAQTAAWPNRPIKMIVPAGPGAAPDVVARLLADRLSAAWGQGVVVENRPGAGGIPGMSALARSAPDGYTIGFVPAAMGTITPLVYKNPQFNPDTDLLPVGTVGISPLMLAVNASTGIKSLADLGRHAKAQPGKVNFAAAQLNSLPHLAGEMVNKLAAMGLYTVPYPAPPAAVTAVLAGDATLTADGIPGLLQHVRSGKLQALAVTSAQRLPGLDFPTVAETFPGYEVVGWFQLIMPAGTPTTVAERVNAELNRITRQPDVVARLADFGVYPRQDTLAGSREFFVAQQKVARRLVDELGITPQ